MQRIVWAVMAAALVGCGVQQEEVAASEDVGVVRQEAGFNENTCVCYDENKDVIREFTYMYCSSTPIGRCPSGCPRGTRYASIVSTRCTPPTTTVYDWFCGEWPDFVPCSGI